MDKVMKWMGLFPSLLFLVVGALVLIFPSMLSGLAVLVLGVLLLLAGAGYLYSYMKIHPKDDPWDAIIGAVCILFGLLLAGAAFSTAPTLVGILLGIFAIVFGLTRLAPAILLRKDMPHWWLLAFFGVAIILLGIWILTIPAEVTTTLAVLVGIMLLVMGVVGCVQYATRKPKPPKAPPQAKGTVK